MLGGFFNSKSKTQNTQNTTNTSITQDMSDNSYNDNRQNTDIVMSGQFAGVNNQGGNISIVDGGAFNVASQAINGVIDLTGETVGQMANLADRGFSLADSLGQGGFMLADSLGQGGFMLADSVTARSNNLADSLARYNSDVARDSIDSSRAITGALLSYASQESEQSRNLSENTTRYALQAVDSISRSDGQQLGVESLQTQKWVMIALAAGAVGIALIRKG
ncbi:hypothetical protein [Arsukibacterium sp.]|uniref:hypothetical protein n=1 Tax=Arsukibacterium sp. TaxID=1977258 RepID=UPI002FD89FF1